LKLFPHFSLEQNAAYQIDPPALRMGYFQSGKRAPFPGSWVYTCLSQDLIAHELTHGLLLGLNMDPGEPGPDAQAFQEAFADLIPLFQHFWKSDVLRAQIRSVRGDLRERSTLGAVGLQFGQALRKPDGIRNPLGRTDPKGVWHPRRPDPKLYHARQEPHDRGDILVAAVFEAFTKIYDSRVADLRRIASKGTGVLAPGTI